MNNLLSSNDISTDNSVDMRLRRLRQDVPPHGGDVETAAARYGIPLTEWVDLSTGLNPQPYPIPEIPVQAFQDLPYWRPEFLQAAENYYENRVFLPVVGSQQAIQTLPNVLMEESCRDVLLPEIGYQEHAKQWGSSGAKLAYYSSLSAHDMCKDIDVSLDMNAGQHLVVIRPNNPTAVEIANETLCRWAEKLSKGCYLIVDEAFIEVSHHSLLTMEMLPNNIIVLRSFGKFFGLAGIRLGFVFARKRIIEKLTDIFGIWQINGPAQVIATIAMNDIRWQESTRRLIAINSEMMEKLLEPLTLHFNLKRSMNTVLFSSYAMDVDLALSMNDTLAKLGLLTRVVIIGKKDALLRFGNVNANNDSEIKRVKDAVEILCGFDTVAAMLDYHVDIT